MASHDETGRLEQATRTSVPSMVSRAFLVAGLFFVVFAILWVVTALTDADVETWRNGAIGPIGWFFAFGGLLGLFRYGFFGRASGWARAGAFFAAIGILGATFVAIWSLLQLAGAVPEPTGLVEGIGSAGILIGVVPAFVSFSVASFRNAELRRMWGVLLAVPPAIFLAITALGIAMGVGTTAADWVAVLAGTGQAVAMFAISSSLRSEAKSA